MSFFINHTKTEKADRWARKTYPERYPKTIARPTTEFNEGVDHGESDIESTK